jgi:hypothetical protein
MASDSFGSDLIAAGVTEATINVYSTGPEVLRRPMVISSGISRRLNRSSRKPLALLEFAMENRNFEQRRARGTVGLGFGGGGGGGGGGGNAHRQQTVGGLGCTGRDAGLLGKDRPKVGTRLSVGGLAFVYSSTDATTDEEFGLIPAAKHQRQTAGLERRRCHRHGDMGTWGMSWGWLRRAEEEAEEQGMICLDAAVQVGWCKGLQAHAGRQRRRR